MPREYIKKTQPVVGDVFGRLEVVSACFMLTEKSGRSRKYVFCRCTCGVTKSFRCSGLLNKKKSLKSCGCDKEGTLHNRKHGAADHPLYNVWNGMLQRCYNTNNKSYGCYGGRGISVCEAWRDPYTGFSQFLQDIGEKPDGCSLERKDVNSGYSPENCVWAKASIQNYNKTKFKTNTSGRTGVYVRYDGAFMAKIGVGGRVISLGAYSTFEEACEAREEAESKYYGFVKD